MPGLTQGALNFPVQKRKSVIKLNIKENNDDIPRRISRRLQSGDVQSIYNVNSESSPIKKSKNDKRKVLGESSILNQPRSLNNILKSPKKTGQESNAISLSPPSLCQYVLKTPEKIKYSVNSPMKTEINFASPVKLKPLNVLLNEVKPTCESRPQETSKRTLKTKDANKSSDIKALISPVKRLSTSCPGSPKKVNSSSPRKIPSKAIGIARPDVEIYQRLKQNLSSNVESKIIGRDAEIKVMSDFLETNLTKSLSGSIYISGAPGTGKTASVLKIVDGLKLRSLKKVYLNCMNQKSTKDLFMEIASQFSINTKQNESNLVKSIEHAITKQGTTLLILDEIDQLESKNQSVLYTIFEWPSLAGSKLVLVGIANMLDLTDRILPRLQSNPATRPKLLNFPPYTRTEIIRIINDRINSADIGGVEVIKPSAVSFLAGKIASVAGDVRKALDVCRRAVELTESEVRRQTKLTVGGQQSPVKSIKQIDIGRIHKLFKDVYSSGVTQEIQDNPNSIPLQQKVLICSFLLMLKYAKSKNVTIRKLHEVYSKVCKKQRLPSLDQSEFLSMCYLLESRGILEIRKTKEPRNAKILMRLSEDETEQAMGDKNLMVSILEDKESLGNYCSRKI